MKKFITFLLASILSLSLCSCGNNTPTTSDTENTSIEDVSTDSTTEETETSSSENQ